MSGVRTTGTTAQPGGKPKPYQRRHPERKPAYQAVQQHLETWLVRQQEEDPDGIGIPAYVERDLRNFLQCGILAYGFARARCGGCGHDFLVAFPKWLRHFLNRDNNLFNRVIRICQGETERALQRHSTGAPEGTRCGGIAFIHRFGSSLNPHPHLHLVLMDGVIAAADKTGRERLLRYCARPVFAWRGVQKEKSFAIS